MHAPSELPGPALISVYQDDDELELDDSIAKPVVLEAGEARPGQDKWRDLPWAAAFSLHTCVVLIMALSSGANLGSGARYAPSMHKAAVLVGGVALLLLASAVLAVLWLRLLIRHAADLIEVVLWGTAGGCALVAVVYFTLISGGWLLGLVFGIAALAAFFFAVGVQDRVPFASSTLRVACKGLQAQMPGLLLVGLGTMLVVATWVLVWSAAYLGSVGATAAARGFWRGWVGEPLLLLSLCWGCQVGVGVAHLTSAGAVADWWVHGDRNRVSRGAAASGHRSHVVASVSRSGIGTSGGAAAAEMADDDGDVGGFRGLGGIEPSARSAMADQNEEVAVDLDFSFTSDSRATAADDACIDDDGGFHHRNGREPHYFRDALAEVFHDLGLSGLDCSGPGGSSNSASVLELGPVVWGSLGRACSTSFGSACCGALVVAVLHATKAMLKDAEQRLRWHYYHGSLGLALGAPQQRSSNATAAPSSSGRRGRFRYSHLLGHDSSSATNHSSNGGSSSGLNTANPFLDRCVVKSLRFLAYCVGRLEALAEYYNRYAYVCCALHGDDFSSAGARATSLFRRCGWSAIVNDSLVDAALQMGGLLSGALVGVLGWWIGASSGVGTDAAFLLCCVGLLSGYGLCGVLMHGLVTSSVATVFVCFAEAPHDLASHHPELHRELLAAWQHAHPEALPELHISDPHDNQHQHNYRNDGASGGNGGGGIGSYDYSSGAQASSSQGLSDSYLKTQVVAAKEVEATTTAAARPRPPTLAAESASHRPAADAAAATLRAATASGDRSGAAAARLEVAARNAEAAELILAPQRVPLTNRSAKRHLLGASVTFADLPESAAAAHNHSRNHAETARRGDGDSSSEDEKGGLMLMSASSTASSSTSGSATVQDQQVHEARVAALASSVYGSLYGSTYGSTYGSMYTSLCASAGMGASNSAGGLGASSSNDDSSGFASISLGTSNSHAPDGREAAAWGWNAKLDLHGLFLAEAEVI